MELGDARNLAERIRRERSARAWSAGKLVARMQEFGVTTPRSAISKIENGDRDVTALELAALARSFGTTTDELLEPLEIVDNRLARELLRKRREVVGAVLTSLNDFVELQAEMDSAYRHNRDVYDWVMSHAFSRAGSGEGASGISEDRFGLLDNQAIAEVFEMLILVLQSIGSATVQEKKGDSRGKH